MTLKYTRPKPELARLEDKIAGLAEAYPNVTLDHPWGHHAYKVNGKTFLFLSTDAEGLSLSVKLPHSRTAALALPYTEPTHYGLGKSGWVSARFAVASEASLPLIERWLAESYRSIAPKKLAAQVTEAGSPANGATAKGATAKAQPAKGATAKARSATRSAKAVPSHPRVMHRTPAGDAQTSNTTSRSRATSTRRAKGSPAVQKKTASSAMATAPKRPRGVKKKRA